jgi:hypothetical protein
MPLGQTIAQFSLYARFRWLPVGLFKETIEIYEKDE